MTTQTEPAWKLELTRVFKASPERVYAAWSKPELWARWFPPHGFTMTIDHMDFRVGGTFAASFHGMGFVHPFTGTYVELVPGERIAWTAAFPESPVPDQIRTTVVLAATPDGQTEMRVRQEFAVVTPETEQATQGAHEGWSQTLDKLAAFLAEA